MNTVEILQVLNNDFFASKYDCYVLPLNHFLHTNFDKPSLIVFNYDDCDKSGSHWVAVFIDKNNIEYFDSYAIPPLTETLLNKIEFLSVNKTIKFNSTCFQGDSTSVCGQYCLIYLLLCSRGYQMKSICKTLLHCKFSSERDVIVNDFINHHFLTLFNNPLTVYKKI